MGHYRKGVDPYHLGEKMDPHGANPEFDLLVQYDGRRRFDRHNTRHCVDAVYSDHNTSTRVLSWLPPGGSGKGPQKPQDKSDDYQDTEHGLLLSKLSKELIAGLRFKTEQGFRPPAINPLPY